MKSFARTFMFVAVLLLCGMVQAQAQNQKSEEKSVQFAIVDDKPMFRGGEASKFALWVSEQVKYPEEAYKGNIQGRAFLQFVIAKDGKVKNVKVLRSSGNKLLDDEAVRVISMSPDWTPGKVDGKPVDVSFMFPVVFKLTGKEKTGAISYIEVEEKPTFMGKNPNEEFAKWMFTQVKYPEEAYKNGVEGRVSLKFTIAKDGKVKDIAVAGSSGNKLLDAEAMRVMLLSPNWEPGKQKGEAVDVTFIFPFVFKLK